MLRNVLCFCVKHVHGKDLGGRVTFITNEQSVVKALRSESISNLWNLDVMLERGHHLGSDIVPMLDSFC